MLSNSIDVALSLHVDRVNDGQQRIPSTCIVVGRTVRRVSEVKMYVCSTFTFFCLQYSYGRIQFFIPHSWQYWDATFFNWFKCDQGLKELFHEARKTEKIFYGFEISRVIILCGDTRVKILGTHKITSFNGACKTKKRQYLWLRLHTCI